MIRLPLSLLDLLACSFGGVILLFFVTIISIQEESATALAGQSRFPMEGDSPFILVLASKDDSAPLFENTETAFWTVEPPVKETEIRTFIVKNHTVLCLEKAPSPETKLTLSGVNTETDILGTVFISGKTIPLEKSSFSGTVSFSGKDLQ